MTAAARRPYFSGFRSPRYTPIPDEFFDEVMPQLSGAEVKVLLYIMRRTFGFKKDSDHISLRQMVEGIRTRDGRQLDRGAGVSKQSAVTAAQALAAMGLIETRRNQSAERGDEATTYTIRFADSAAVSTPRVQKLATVGVQAVDTPLSTELTPAGPTGGHPPVQGLDPQETAPQEPDAQDTDAQQALTASRAGPAHDELWQSVLTELEAQMSQPNFQTWLVDTRLVDLTPLEAVIIAPTTYQRDWLAARFDKLVARAIARLVGRQVSVRFTAV
jgi:hypothetical protein